MNVQSIQFVNTKVINENVFIDDAYIDMKPYFLINTFDKVINGIRNFKIEFVDRSTITETLDEYSENYVE